MNVSSAAATDKATTRLTSIAFDGQISTDGQIQLENLSLVHQPCPAGTVLATLGKSSLLIGHLSVPKQVSAKRLLNGK